VYQGLSKLPALDAVLEEYNGVHCNLVKEVFGNSIKVSFYLLLFLGARYIQICQ